MSEEEKHLDYLSYKKNKMAQNVEKTPPNKVILWIFILTFTFCFAVVINITSRYGKKMDIEYGRALDTKNVSMDDPYVKGVNPITDFIDEKKSQIDERLRILQLEETAPNEAKIIDKKREVDVLDKSHLEKLLKEEKEKQAEATKKVQETPEPVAKPSFSKVLIGRYNSFDEAKEAQAELSAAKNTPTLIRKMGDIYSLQIGSYSSEVKAQEIADKFSGSYPVWILQD